MSRSRPSKSLSNLEISSPVGFDLYFQNEAPSGSISHASIMANLALANDPEAFGQRLVAMSQKKLAGGASLAIEFLARLEDYTEEIIPKENIPSILMAIFDVGDELWCHEKEMPRILGLGAYSYIMRVIYQLSRRLSKQERFEAYRDAFSKGRALATICREARALAGEHGHSRVGDLRPEEQRQLSPEHEQEIRKVVMSRVKTAAQDGSLLDSGTDFPLFFWEETEGPEKVREWVAEYVKADKGLAAILEAFLIYVWDMNSERRDPHVPIDSLRTFVTPSTIIDRARGLLREDWLKGEQRVAVETFVRKYDDMKRAGLDPDTDTLPKP